MNKLNQALCKELLQHLTKLEGLTVDAEQAIEWNFLESYCAMQQELDLEFTADLDPRLKHGITAAKRYLKATV